jgi:hypothetical protein
LKLKKGRYILNGSPITSVNNVEMHVATTKNGSYWEFPNSQSRNNADVVFEITDSELAQGKDYCSVAIYCKIGLSTVSNLTFKPMIRLASVSDATYEPYHINSYPLDSDLELRGIPKLSNGSLYYDGDVYESSGAVTRVYGIRAYQSGDESLADAITDGTNTVYKLTTPTAETAQPYANPQVVSPLGTEEYIDTRDVPVPVGHETFYPLEVGYGYTFISDLPAFGSGDIPSNLYLAVDDGENTMKISAIDLVTKIVNSMN